MSKLRITYVKSSIGYARNQKETIKALGLRKLNQYVERPDNPSVRGMIETVKHLVRVEDADAVPAPTKPVTRRPKVIAGPATAAPVVEPDQHDDTAAPVDTDPPTAPMATSAHSDSTSSDDTNNSDSTSSDATDSQQDTTKEAGNETA